MTRKSLKNYNCNIARTLDIVGDKWSMMILRDAMIGVSSFSTFHSSLGIAKNILSERLSNLVDHEILEKRQTKPGVERYTYHLTERGKDFLPVLIALGQWDIKWVSGKESITMRFLERETGEDIKRVRVQGRRGNPVGLDDLEIAPGPGANQDTLDVIEYARKKQAKARQNSK